MMQKGQLKDHDKGQEKDKISFVSYELLFYV
jgi:hypothetical protein